MTAALPVDITATPCSIRGSFFALSIPDDQAVPGVYLRTVRGGARSREILRLVVGGSALSSVEVHAGLAVLTHGDSRVEVAFSGPGRALIRVLSGTLELECCVRSAYDVVLEERPDVWRFIHSGAVRNYRLWLAQGTAEFSTGWHVERSTEGRLRLSALDGPSVLVIDEVGSAPRLGERPDVDAAIAAAASDFEAWWLRHGAPAVHEERFAAAALQASYASWSAIVPAGGVLTRESMLMSKNRMAHVWSWDHCFNAMALYRDADGAFDQLQTIFDHQDEFGGLPDHIDDAGVQFNFAKPPIHGWAVSWLMKHGGLRDEHLAVLEDGLLRWSDWWRTRRDYRGDGFPSYNHGNDSGWDNSTVFGGGVPVQSPELLAFLALQDDALARIADRLGRPAAAAARRRSAETTVAALVEHFWTGKRFAARDTRTGDRIDSVSLLTLMPLALGELLPREVFDAAVDTLVDGGYVTDHGVATEPPSSPAYEPDGYWRGPVWAPTTLLLVDGLRRGGRVELADRIGTAFIETCARSGMAENFDALTGAGLRDRSMTWTASVLLTLLDTAPTTAVPSAAELHSAVGA